MSAKMIHQTLSFLERNPAIMTQAKLHGLQDSTVQMIKAKYHTAELYDRNEMATKRLANEAKQPLTPRQKEECLRDKKMYELLSNSVKQELDLAGERPEYKARIQELSQKVVMDMMSAPPQDKEKVNYINNSKLNLALKEGMPMPTAIKSLAGGLAKFQQQVEKGMQQPQVEAPVVQGPGVPGT